MIRTLTGMISEISDNEIVINVNGVGYLVFCPSFVKQSLPAMGATTTLWIETQMSEHALILYGFLDMEQVKWFRLLIGVHGVGAKAACAILSALSLDDLFQAISQHDAKPLIQAQGVGNQLAMRIVNELKNKLPSHSSPSPQSPTINSHYGEVISVLVKLGYGERQAKSVLSKVLEARKSPSSDLDNGAGRTQDASAQDASVQDAQDNAPAIADIIKACLRELVI